jgi:hypothetical protein
MSFLYRPTPVVNLGRGQFASQAVTLANAPGGVMHGIDLDRNYKPSADKLRRVPSGNPWITRSGVMGEFVPKGLGGLGDDEFVDDFSSGDFYSGADYSPNIPAFTPGAIAPDFGGPIFSPTAPVFGSPLPSGPSIPFALPAPGSLETSWSPLPSTLTPPAGTGASGAGLPGTQPLNTSGLLAASAGTSSLLNSIANFFKPSNPLQKSGLTALPGYGGTPVKAPTSPVSSWFAAPSGILPGSSNGTLALSAAALALIFISMGKK